MDRRLAKRLDHCPAPFLDEKRGYLVDWLTQLWVKAARKQIDRSDGWLFGPSGSPRGIGEMFYGELAKENGLELKVNEPGSGLVDQMSTLVPGSKLDQRIADFYERTSDYCLHVTSQWCGLFYPFGWLLSFVFSRRLHQLNVPLSCKARALDLSSDIMVIRSPETGKREYTGWFRKRNDDDSTVYVGLYCHSALEDGTPVLKVAFPLPNGNATVIMRADVTSDGSLVLSADGRKFGAPGFYFVVRDGDDRAHARLVRSVHEQIHVYVTDGELQADHEFFLFGHSAFRLHYQMDRKGAESEAEPLVTINSRS